MCLHTLRARSVPQVKLPYRELRIPRRDFCLIGNFLEISYYAKKRGYLSITSLILINLIGLDKHNQILLLLEVKLRSGWHLPSFRGCRSFTEPSLSATLNKRISLLFRMVLHNSDSVKQTILPFLQTRYPLL